MAHKIIQWNCHGYKANYDELLLLIAKLNPTAICLQETFRKRSDKLNIKTFEQYDYIHDTGQRASGGASILIRKDIPQNKISINTHFQQLQSQQPYIKPSTSAHYISHLMTPEMKMN